MPAAYAQHHTGAAVWTSLHSRDTWWRAHVPHATDHTIALHPPAAVSTRRRAVQVMVTGSTNPMQKTSGVGRRRPSLPPIAEKEQVCIRESSRSQKSERIATYACALTSSPCNKPAISTQSHRQHSYTDEESQTTSNLSRSIVHESNHSGMIQSPAFSVSVFCDYPIQTLTLTPWSHCCSECPAHM